MTAWLQQTHGLDPAPGELRGVALDGKTLRGTKSLDQRALNHFLEQQLGWSGVKPAFRITRRRIIRDRETGESKTSTEVVYGITSLTRDPADAEKLLALNRGHGGLENQRHGVRDETFGADKSRLRTNHGPQQLATARNAAIALCRVNNDHPIAAARREFAWNLSRLFAILGLMKL